MSKTNTKYTSQHIDNQSFDEALQMRVTEFTGSATGGGGFISIINE